MRRSPGGALALRIFFATFPLWSLGLLAWVPSLRIALLRQRAQDRVAAVGFAVLTVVYVFLLARVPSGEEMTDLQALAVGVVMLSLGVGAVVHAVVADVPLPPRGTGTGAVPGPPPGYGYPQPGYGQAPAAYGYPQPGYPTAGYGPLPGPPAPAAPYAHTGPAGSTPPPWTPSTAAPGAPGGSGPGADARGHLAHPRTRLDAGGPAPAAAASAPPSAQPGDNPGTAPATNPGTAPGTAPGTGPDSPASGGPGASPRIRQAVSELDELGDLLRGGDDRR
ncbi:hypothetical protein [Streptomyces otsuchiensis]|uniref:hypothetical protein n=1 Tax=Streptomyces otsuchiensis TaxID=2681388 RepID=UPI001031D4E1|nr:hypothetical protein [Streptomyces otsuchiensis]